MLLTIETTHSPATDLGYLLAKHPARCQTFSLAYGKAHVFYPEASEARCVAALLLDFDPVGLVRDRRPGPEAEGSLALYVNDRPYTASSFLSVAIAQVFASAMKGVSKERQAVADAPMPLEATLDEKFPEWGEGNCFELELRANVRLADLLTHLYVLIPVLDNHKHYWVGGDEVTKLLDKGGDWLKAHPMREQSVTRYLKRQRALTRDAFDRLMADDESESESESAEAPDDSEESSSEEAKDATLDKPVRLNDQRLDAVVAALQDLGATRRARSPTATSASRGSTWRAPSRSSNTSRSRAWPLSSASCSSSRARPPSCSRRRTPSSTSASRPCPRASSGTAITGSSGRASNSNSGVKASRSAMATACASPS
ncbi:MAG: hypothetical protein LBM75_07500 [Myxococcales bacterium]|jgi:hypothetical protein|nr:hypothetical protein [Myxococcales bacterium]